MVAKTSERCPDDHQQLLCQSIIYSEANRFSAPPRTPLTSAPAVTSTPYWCLNGSSHVRPAERGPLMALLLQLEPAGAKHHPLWSFKLKVSASELFKVFPFQYVSISAQMTAT